MKPGRAGTMTHDYKRHGTTTLFAALNILDGTVIGRNMQRHRHQEFIRFLNTIEAQVPVGKVIHAIVDNYATHKHPKVRQWLARHPRWTFHFTPTSASWLNAVEGFFAKLTRQRLKRGVFRSVIDLQVAINRFVAETNLNPKPFVWTADPKRVLAAVKRGKQTLEVSPLATMCEWTAVEEWLAQQRAEAEARARMWQLFGPQPSTARIEEVRQWSLGSLARRVLRGPSPAMKLSATSDVICCRGPDPNGVPPIPRHHTARIERASS